MVKRTPIIIILAFSTLCICCREKEETDYEIAQKAIAIELNKKIASKQINTKVDSIVVYSIEPLTQKKDIVFTFIAKYESRMQKANEEAKLLMEKGNLLRYIGEKVPKEDIARAEEIQLENQNIIKKIEQINQIKDKLDSTKVIYKLVRFRVYHRIKSSNQQVCDSLAVKMSPNLLKIEERF